MSSKQKTQRTFSTKRKPAPKRNGKKSNQEKKIGKSKNEIRVKQESAIAWADIFASRLSCLFDRQAVRERAKLVAAALIKVERERGQRQQQRRLPVLAAQREDADQCQLSRGGMQYMRQK